MHPVRSRPGWTLVELLVVCGVLAALLGITLPAIQKARESASYARCRNNLAQLALAAHVHDHTLGHLPAYSTGQPGTPVRGGWWIYLLPYVEQEGLYRRIMDAAAPFQYGTGTVGERAVREPDIRRAPFPVLTCRSDYSKAPPGEDRTATNYVANWYVFGDSVRDCYKPPQRLAGVKDGLSNTALFAEAYRTCGGVRRAALEACCNHNFGITWDGKPSDDPSYEPEDYTLFQAAPAAAACDPLRAQSAHATMPVAAADGSVQAVLPGIDPAVWKQVLKPRDGGPLGSPW